MTHCELWCVLHHIFTVNLFKLPSTQKHLGPDFFPSVQVIFCLIHMILAAVFELCFLPYTLYRLSVLRGSISKLMGASAEFSGWICNSLKVFALEVLQQLKTRVVMTPTFTSLVVTVVVITTTFSASCDDQSWHQDNCQFSRDTLQQFHKINNKSKMLINRQRYFEIAL